MLMASGSVDDYGAEAKASIAEEIAQVAGVPASAVQVTISAASVLIKAVITASQASEIQAVSQSLTEAFTDPQAATEILSRAVPDLIVESTPSVTEVQAADDSQAALPDEGVLGMSFGVMVVMISGSVALIVIAGLTVCCVCKPKAKRSSLDARGASTASDMVHVIVKPEKGPPWPPLPAGRELARQL